MERIDIIEKLAKFNKLEGTNYTMLLRDDYTGAILEDERIRVFYFDSLQDLREKLYRIILSS